MPMFNNSAVSGAGTVVDSSSLTLATADAGVTRVPSGSLTYTLNPATAWTVGQVAPIFLPTSGTVSFAVTGGATLNGSTSTLTRTLGGNSAGTVVLRRIQGTNAYGLDGA